MDAVAAIIGVGFVSFIILYFVFNMKDTDHPIIRLLLILFAFIFLILVPKVIIDTQSDCEILLNKSEEVYRYGDNFSGYHWDYDNSTAPKLPGDAYLFHKNTTFTYSEYCTTATTTTAATFYKMVIWLYRLFAAYIIVYLFVLSLQYLWGSHKRGKV